MEQNALTQKLLREGYKPEETPPGCKPYNKYYGGWEYSSEHVQTMVFETPCGLLVKGLHFLTGHMSFAGVEWTVENGYPTVTCPRFELRGTCKLNHPLLQNRGTRSGIGTTLTACACRLTNRPYTYEGSVERAHDLVWEEADRVFAVFDQEKDGRACKEQSRYSRGEKKWRIEYDPMICARMASCRYCKVLGRALDTKRGNVFFDEKVTHTQKGEGLFSDREVVSITKGIKLLERPVSLTICQAIVKYGRHRVEQTRMLNNWHSAMFMDKSLRVEFLNFRAARMDVRDLLQDLEDVKNGIKVTHKKDNESAVAEQKRQRRAAEHQAKVTRLEKLVLERGVAAMEDFEYRRALKFLGEDRMYELEKQRSIETMVEQIALF